MSKYDNHPQNATIVKRILEGKSARAIAEGLNPPVTQSAMHMYRKTVLGQAVSPLRPHKRAGAAIVAAVDGQTADLAAYHRRVKGERIAEELEDVKQRLRQKWITDAETAQRVNPETGVVSHNMDHRALAQHTRNHLSALELEAKLAGLLNEQAPAGGVNVMFAIALPRAAAGDQAAEIIDVGVQEDRR